MIFAPGRAFSLSQRKVVQCRSEMSIKDLYSKENFRSFKSSASLVVKVREEAGEKKKFSFSKLVASVLENKTVCQALPMQCE